MSPSPRTKEAGRKQSGRHPLVGGNGGVQGSAQVESIAPSPPALISRTSLAIICQYIQDAAALPHLFAQSAELERSAHGAHLGLAEHGVSPGTAGGQVQSSLAVTCGSWKAGAQRSAAGTEVTTLPGPAVDVVSR